MADKHMDSLVGQTLLDAIHEIQDDLQHLNESRELQVKVQSLEEMVWEMFHTNQSR